MSKPLPILSQMPWNVKNEIVEAVDFKTRFPLRRCSSELKAFVDDAKVTYVNLTIRCWYYHAVVITVILFKKCYKIFAFHMKENPKFIESAVKTVQDILQNPNLRLQSLDIDFQKPSSENESLYTATKHRLLECLTPVLINRKLIVEKLTIYSDGSHDDILLFLSCIQPRTLKEICLGSFCEDNRMRVVLPLNLTEIAETEQWKQAKHLDLERYDHTLPFAKMSHFLSVETRRKDFNAKDLNYILDNFLGDNGWESLVLLIINFNSSVLRSIFSKLEIVENPWSFIEAQFKVRRGEHVCRILLHKIHVGHFEVQHRITFFNPSKRPDLESKFSK